MVPRGALPLITLALALAGCDDLPRRCARDAGCPLLVDDGQPCLASGDCRSRLCFDRGQGGICARPCRGPTDCSVSGEVCVPIPGRAPPGTAAESQLVCQRAGSGQAFLGEACADDGACRSGLCEGQGCTQPCGACPGRMACEAATLSRGGTSLSTTICKVRYLDVLELGGLNVAQSAASSLTFTIDAGVESFLVFADDKDDLRVALTRLEAPDGAVLVDTSSPDAALMRAYDYLGTATAQVPGSDVARARVQAGRYTLAVRTYEKRFDVMTPVAGSVERVAVIWRRSRQHGGLLDLELFFSPATGIAAATATTNPYVTEMLGELQTLFRSQLGVGLGDVRSFDLTAAEDAIGSADAARAVREKFSQLGPRSLSVSVFVVKAISYGFEAVAGGIPGVPGLAKRPGTGIVAELQASGKTMGRMLAHELGHYLGLFHTTEPGATTFDTISDTPSCPAGTPASSCPDRQNLMFPTYLQSPGPLVLSVGQAAVLRGSPFLYETVYPEACGPMTEVVDVSTHRFASGSTKGSPSALGAPCGGGGASASERVHLYRVGSPPPKTLEVEVIGQGFDPVVYALQGTCTSGAPVIACQSGAAGAAVKLTLTALEPGAYFFVVDGKSGAGRYTLAVR